MSNKWKYLLSYALPWASMLSIEKNGIALATFVLQLSVIGWIPASIWAHAEMKKHLQTQGDEPKPAKPAKPAEPLKTSKEGNSSQEIIKASKKITAAKKTKPNTTKKITGTTKPKTKPKASS